MVTSAVARMAPPELLAPPMVRMEVGARKREEPASICRVLTLKPAPRLEAAELRRMFWSLKRLPRYSAEVSARMLPAADV